MKKRALQNSLTVIGLLLILFIIKFMIDVPWWLFVIPIFIFGLILRIKNVNANYFSLGFIAGFIFWIAPNFLFCYLNGSIVFEKLAVLTSLPIYLIIIISGIMGGLLVGLSFYSSGIIINNKNKKNNFYEDFII